jgi:hypothetical protein
MSVNFKKFFGIPFGARPTAGGFRWNLANLKPQFPLTSAAIETLHGGSAHLGVDHENISDRRFSIALVRHLRNARKRQLVQQPEQQHYV